VSFLVTVAYEVAFGVVVASIVDKSIGNELKLFAKYPQKISRKKSVVDQIT
jgi:hypothetical protein